MFKVCAGLFKNIFFISFRKLVIGFAACFFDLEINIILRPLFVYN